ncbi:hypothetical protein K4F52_004839 [Lecanicillium sp. MT-2017a]|nr:hypothetical protein K4F52_004839 [Lecanicillium sp. MT-2017a]
MSLNRRAVQSKYIEGMSKSIPSLQYLEIAEMSKAIIVNVPKGFSTFLNGCAMPMPKSTKPLQQFIAWVNRRAPKASLTADASLSVALFSQGSFGPGFEPQPD